jgi:quercetin dioxygenase-like cupin family protein
MQIKSIVWALQLILALFITTSLASGNGVQVNVLTKSIESWNKSTLPQYPQGQPQVTILRILIPPGSILPLHTHPVINAGVLIKGELTVETKAGETLHLKAGDPIVEVVNTWHYGKNDGMEPADIIVFYAGTKDAPITVK